MGIKAKIGLLILLVAGVIGVIIWDKSTAPNPSGGTAKSKGLIAPVPARDEASTVRDTATNGTREPAPIVTPPSRPPKKVVTPPPTRTDPLESEIVEIVGPVKPKKPAIDEVPTRDEIPTRIDPTPRKEPTGPTVPEKPTIAERPLTPDTYVVKKDDSLWAIAESLYGHGRKWRKILDANKDKISEGDTLKIGLVLNIPKDVETPTETPATTAAPTIPAEFQGKDIHTVEPGDSLYSIAQKVYGDANLWRHILDANKDRMADENTLTVGQILVIPKVEKPEKTEKPTAEKVSTIPPELAGKRTYTVKTGDSLSTISEEFFGTPNKWKEIYEANKKWMQSEHTLKVGQVLVIPDLPVEKENSKSRGDEGKTSASESEKTPRRRDASRLVSD